MSKPPRKDNPSSTFYWKDYENDEGLRISSLAAQGLWMRLLCIAAKADPYGYILVNGCDPGVTGTARLGSVTEAEAATLLDELERNGVFSRDRKGRPFSRRMVKEAAISAKNRKNGKKGGNPALGISGGKEKEKEGSLNPQDKPRVKAPYPLPSSLSQREEHEGKPSCPAPSAADADHPPDPKPKPDPKARLPSDWALSDEGWAYARSQKIPDEVIEDEARGFHAYWSDRRDRDASKSERGWEQCWANRCRSIAGRYAGRGMAGQTGPGRHGQGSSIASIVLRRQAGGAD